MPLPVEAGTGTNGQKPKMVCLIQFGEAVLLFEYNQTLQFDEDLTDIPFFLNESPKFLGISKAGR